MIQISPQTRVLVATEPTDFRRGIDGLVRVCRETLGADPFSGAVFVFRSKRGSAIKLLVYDGQGFWLCHKRLSQGRFRFWPSRSDGAGASLRAHELGVLLWAGDPRWTQAAPEWRPVAAAG